GDTSARATWARWVPARPPARAAQAWSGPPSASLPTPPARAAARLLPPSTLAAHPASAVSGAAASPSAAHSALPRAIWTATLPTAGPPRPVAGHRAAAPPPVSPAWWLEDRPVQTVTGARCAQSRDRGHW